MNSIPVDEPVDRYWIFKYFAEIMVPETTARWQTIGACHPGGQYFSYRTANTQRNKHVIITQKRGFDAVITCLLRYVFAEQSHVSLVM